MSATGTVVGKNGCEADTFNGNETLIVSVQNTALMDAPAITLGQQNITLNQGNTFPISFNVQYDAEAASNVPDYGFTIRAMIEDNNGKLLYISDTRTSARDNQIQVRKV